MHKRYSSVLSPFFISVLVLQALLMLLPPQDELLLVFFICNMLWIKASATLENVNLNVKSAFLLNNPGIKVRLLSLHAQNEKHFSSHNKYILSAAPDPSGLHTQHSFSCEPERCLRFRRVSVRRGLH